MNNPALPHGLDRGIPSGAANATERGEKYSSGKKPRNSLKTLDPDERIQGNPRKSNPSKAGLRSETVTGQENPNGSDRTDVAETAANRRVKKYKMV